MENFGGLSYVRGCSAKDGRIVACKVLNDENFSETDW